MSSTQNRLFKKVDSSDYITFKKQAAISQETSAPIKKNGLKYNRNFTFIPASIDASNCLIRAQSYDLMNNYTTGQDNTKIICEK